MSNAVPLRTGMEPYPGYRLRQLLGRGGFAEVWEAETTDGQTVALKFLPCNDGLAASKEIRSIQAVRQIRHNHLIHIDQVWTHLGYIVVAMELAEGSLLDLLEAYGSEMGTPVPPEQVCLYLSQAADAIDFMNARQHQLDGRKVAFQHCDIKPSNMLLFGDSVKLADFGLASPTTAALKFHRRAGTMDFIAPEVFQGRLSDWTDQYALAVSYCQLRGGRMPFADTPDTIQRDYVRPTPDLSMVSEKERPIIARALATVPQNRWPSCTDFISRVSQAVVD
ncbi:MAG: serine/threonine protein kinase [Gemmataceae bacterium]|nr:serine/threonine protein kinase [Gemmataceae bacterium]